MQMRKLLPLKSTSENALQFALDYSNRELNYQKGNIDITFLLTSLSLCVLLNLYF